MFVHLCYKLQCRFMHREQLQHANKIVYRFQDASIPPGYHRSYEIEVAPKVVKITVDSYGDILTQQEYPATEKQFDAVVFAFFHYNIHNCEQKDEQHYFTGGTTDSITCYDDNEVLFSGSVYHSGTGSGNLCGDVEGFSNKIKSLVPDLATLLEF